MRAVIDTNVLAVANLQHCNVSRKCITICVKKLLNLKTQGRVVIDDEYRIIKEYQDNIGTRQGKQVGTVFLKWLLQNKANPDRVEQVHITEITRDHFEEFPDPVLEPDFDPPDRKFVAVANAHPDRPPIWQAADCKWMDWWQKLQKCGIRVKFLCPEDVTSFYHHKFPNRDTPTLP